MSTTPFQPAIVQAIRATENLSNKFRVTNRPSVPAILIACGKYKIVIGLFLSRQVAKWKIESPQMTISFELSGLSRNVDAVKIVDQLISRNVVNHWIRMVDFIHTNWSRTATITIK